MKEKSLIVREVTAHDIPVMVKYRLDYLTELQGDMSLSYRKELSENLNRFISSSIGEGNMYAVIAEYSTSGLSDQEENLQIEGNTGQKHDENAPIPVAFGAMLYKRVPGDAKSAFYVEADILNMYTVPSERRKGISSRVLENLIAHAKEEGVAKLALHTSKDGVNLYKKYGFSEAAYPYLERII
jgi:GNAT superfamily N-acetyltransferase